MEKPAAETAPQEKSVSPINKQFNPLLITGIALVALVVGVGVGYVVGAKKNVQTQDQTQTQIQQNTEETDSVVNWKTYTSKEYGFYLEYPQDWTLGTKPLATDSETLFSQPIHINKSGTDSFGITVKTSNPIESWERLAGKPSEEILVADKNSHSIDWVEEGLSGSTFDQYTKHVVVPLKNNYLQLSLYLDNSENEKETNIQKFNQILSTFDFIDENQESYTKDTGISNQKKFVSPKLGISFLYLDDYVGETIKTKEVENRVYVYSSNNSYDTGQYVEVFQKDPSDTLTEALNKDFLSSDSYKANCSVVDTLVYSNQSEYPNSYQLANIKVKKETNDMEELFAELDKCPSPYTQSNGISYFLMDSEHPDKFLFFSIGQYVINAFETDTAWQDTIKFTD